MYLDTLQSASCSCASQVLPLNLAMPTSQRYIPIALAQNFILKRVYAKKKTLFQRALQLCRDIMPSLYSFILFFCSFQTLPGCCLDCHSRSSNRKMKTSIVKEITYVTGLLCGETNSTKIKGMTRQ